MFLFFSSFDFNVNPFFSVSGCVQFCRYCSVLYPKADSYQVCNWCLNNKDETAEKAQNVSNSSPSSSCKTSSEDESKNKMKRNGYNSNNSDNYQVGIRGQRGSLQLPVKKQRSPEQSPPVRKRIITTGRLEEKLRRTKSEEISHRGITRQLIRNKVRRYKLLDEVSS